MVLRTAKSWSQGILAVLYVCASPAHAKAMQHSDSTLANVSAGIVPCAIPGGIANPVNHQAYIRNANQGIDAIDLATGQTIWSFSTSSEPLLAYANILIVLDTHSAPFHIISLDASRQGRPMLRSDSLPFPAWVQRESANGSVVNANWRIVGDVLWAQWTARQVFAEGAYRKPSLANGIFRVDLRTGSVISFKTDDPNISPVFANASASLTQRLRDVRSLPYTLAMGGISDAPIMVDRYHLALLALHEHDADKFLVLERWNIVTQKSLMPIQLMQGKEFQLIVQPDERLLLVVPLKPSVDKSKNAVEWSIYSLETGNLMGKLPAIHNWIKVKLLGNIALFLVQQTEPASFGKAQTRNGLIQAVDITTGNPLWSRLLSTEALPLAGQQSLSSPKERP